jgi:hypothetical protein
MGVLADLNRLLLLLTCSRRAVAEMGRTPPG